jgi:cytochrome c oxidase subunit IV
MAIGVHGGLSTGNRGFSQIAFLVDFDASRRFGWLFVGRWFGYFGWSVTTLFLMTSSGLGVNCFRKSGWASLIMGASAGTSL